MKPSQKTRRLQAVEKPRKLTPKEASCLVPLRTPAAPPPWRSGRAFVWPRWDVGALLEAVIAAHTQAEAASELGVSPSTLRRRLAAYPELVRVAQTAALLELCRLEQLALALSGSADAGQMRAALDHWQDLRASYVWQIGHPCNPAIRLGFLR